MGAKAINQARTSKEAMKRSKTSPSNSHPVGRRPRPHVSPPRRLGHQQAARQLPDLALIPHQRPLPLRLQGGRDQELRRADHQARQMGRP